MVSYGGKLMGAGTDGSALNELGKISRLYLNYGSVVTTKK